MKVLITGGTGFIGSALTEALLNRHYDVSHLTRSPGESAEGITSFDTIPNDKNFDVIVNLAGHPIADRRWTKSTKDQIVLSRLATTQKVISHIENQTIKPRLFISGSAIGVYGLGKDKGSVRESDIRDSSFSSTLCYQWETVAKQACAMGVRTCILRTGIVLGKNQGALKKMVLPFKLCLGGKVGQGDQWMPWIHIKDMINSILYCIDNEELAGEINLTAPNPVTNEDFTQVLGKVLSRPTFMSMPEWVISLLMGEMGKELLLNGKKVIPSKLLNAGYNFEYTDLQPALTDILKRNHNQ